MEAEIEARQVKKSQLFGIGGGVLGCALLGSLYGSLIRASDRVVFLSVGQGDCTLIESQGRIALIDVGPAADKARGRLDDHLRKLGVTHVDEVLLSHPDADHIGGLPDVMRMSPDVKVYASTYFEQDPKMVSALDRAKVPEQDRIWLTAGQGVVGGFHLILRCDRWQEGEDDNLGSMFVKVAEGGATLVTTGDGPEAEELDELPQADWHAEIIHFGHHGSKTASSMTWLQAVHPEYGIVSCGLHNPYGHPHRQTLDRAREAGIKVHRTDKEGDIEFDVAGGTFRPAGSPGAL